ncbi:MAG: hypothetical protein KGJ73_11385 [Rhodospirillales bacterium]|nr:hypothetical protein [Rhodospirillales bacterium]
MRLINKFELHPEKLDAFRSALSLSLINHRRRSESAHALVLRLGARSGMKYAPIWRGMDLGARRHRASTRFVLPPPHDLGLVRRAGLLTPAYQRRVQPLASGAYKWPLSAIVQNRYHADIAEKRGPVANAIRVAPPRRAHQGVATQKRSFAPLPIMVNASVRGAARTRPHEQGFIKKISGRAEADELISVLPLELPFERAAIGVGQSSVARDMNSIRSSVEPPASGGSYASGTHFGDALEEYFFRQSRLAPSGGAAFDPRLSPLWAGLKLPG